MHASSTGFQQVAFAVVLALLLTAAGELRIAAQAPLLFRIFLKDGVSLVSYGEFSRVGGRVIFTAPLGDATRDAPLQVMSLGENVVDWEKTDAYATAVRARRYAEGRGEDDYAVLVGQVTDAISTIATTTDPQRRIEMAQEARRNLAAWPAANFGFKAAEVAELVSAFDDAIAGMRASAGERSFDFSLVALTAPPPPLELLPPPDARTALELAYRAAMLTDDPAERSAALRALLAALPQELADVAGRALRERASAALASETRTDEQYARLASDLLDRARGRAGRGDVQGLKDVIERALRADERLGRRRPNEMASLLAALDAEIAEARRYLASAAARRLRVEAVKAYRAEIVAPLERLAGFRKWLERIKARSGPDPKYLRPLEDRAHLAFIELSGVTPPPDAAPAHQLLTAAFHMTRHAAALRRGAVSSNDSKAAWDASAAAAGALTLGERALDELHRLISSQPTQ